MSVDKQVIHGAEYVTAECGHRAGWRPITVVYRMDGWAERTRWAGIYAEEGEAIAAAAREYADWEYLL